MVTFNTAQLRKLMSWKSPLQQNELPTGCERSVNKLPNRATANNMENNQPYRKEGNNDFLGSQPGCIHSFLDLSLTSFTTGKLAKWLGTQVQVNQW